MSVAFTWYHTRNGNLWANQDAFYTVNDWTRFDIANPCLGDPKCGAANNAAATIPVFNLNPGTRTGDIVTRSSEPRQADLQRVRDQRPGTSGRRHDDHRRVLHRAHGRANVRPEQPEPAALLRSVRRSVPGARDDGGASVPKRDQALGLAAAPVVRSWAASRS